MFIIQPKHFLDGLSTIIGQFCKASSLIHAIQIFPNRSLLYLHMYLSMVYGQGKMVLLVDRWNVVWYGLV